ILFIGLQAVDHHIRAETAHGQWSLQTGVEIVQRSLRDHEYGEPVRKLNARVGSALPEFRADGPRNLRVETYETHGSFEKSREPFGRLLTCVVCANAVIHDAHLGCRAFDLGQQMQWSH